MSLRLAAILLLGAGLASAQRYPSPIELALSPDGARLYVVCEGTGEVLALDARSGAFAGRLKVGRVPKGIALSSDGRRAWVTNSWDDTISEIDLRAFTLVRNLPAGLEPTNALPDAQGRYLYIANRVSNDISVIDLTTGQEERRLVAGRGASYLARGPGRIYSTHIYPLLAEFRTTPHSEITVIDSGRRQVTAREPLPGAAGVFHMALSADGRLGVVAVLRPKNLIPLAHVEHGWVFGNAIALFGPDAGGTVQLPLDELDSYYTPPFGVTLTSDKRTVYVSTTGADSVTVIDLAKALGYVKTLAPEKRRGLANDLSASANYVAARIPVGRAPKGMALSTDERTLFVANRNDDSISVVDTAARKVTRTFKLPAPAVLTAERRGERLFFSANFAFQRHFGCANCHIEATFDGISWDLEPDGFGKDIVDNRLLEDVWETAPFKWNGGNPDLYTECGPRTEMFFYRSQSYSAKELDDLVRFVRAMPLRPNRYRRSGGELTAQQERGRVIYERTRRKNGAPMTEVEQCAFCHSGKYYTNRKLFDVGTGKPTDRSPLVDVPQLTNVFLTAPYLHDGSARTLEEIWTVFNPNDKHGVTNDLAKDELNDLIEYLKTL